MQFLKKYKSSNSFNLDNLLKPNSVFNFNINLSLSLKNHNNVVFNHNFYNLFLRSFMFFFFKMYSFNWFDVFFIKNNPMNFINLNSNILSITDSSCLIKFSRSNY